MGEVLDGWLLDRPLGTAEEAPGVFGVAWWLLKTGPLAWRGWVVEATPELTIALRRLDVPPYREDVRAAYTTPIPPAWNDPGGVQ
jgi:hypothetical protein